LEVSNEYISIQIVSLDGKTLSESATILVQAGPTARRYGYAEETATRQSDGKLTEGFRITSLGHSPWNLDEREFDHILRNQSVTTAYGLDANGHAVGEISLEKQDAARKLAFPKDALHVILR